MAIAFANNNHGDSAGGSTIGVVWGGGGAGDCFIACIAINSATVTVSSVADNGGSTGWAHRASVTLTNTRVEIWSTSVAGAANNTLFTVTLSGAANAVATMLQYSGGVALGTTGTNSGTAANPTISLTTSDNNNFVVGSFSALTNSVATALTGNFRDGGAVGNASSAGTDNTAASPGSVTNAVTLAATDWAVAALELRTVAGDTSLSVNLQEAQIGASTF